MCDITFACDDYDDDDDCRVDSWYLFSLDLLLIFVLVIVFLVNFFRFWP